ARVEPLLRREPRRPGLPGHLLCGPDRMGDLARGATAAPRPRGDGAAGRRWPLAPRRMAARRRLLAVVPAARERAAPQVARAARPGRRRAGAVAARGRSRDRQPAVLAELDLGPGAPAGAHAGVLQRAGVR